MLKSVGIWKVVKTGQLFGKFNLRCTDCVVAYSDIAISGETLVSYLHINYIENETKDRPITKHRCTTN